MHYDQFGFFSIQENMYNCVYKIYKLPISPFKLTRPKVTKCDYLLNFSHQLSSFVRRCRLIAFTKIFHSESAGPNKTNFGLNHYQGMQIKFHSDAYDHACAPRWQSSLKIEHRGKMQFLAYTSLKLKHLQQILCSFSQKLSANAVDNPLLCCFPLN